MKNGPNPCDDSTKWGSFEGKVKSCFCLEEDHPVRAVITRIVQHTYFERFIILAIISNSIVLAMADYKSVDSNGNLVMTGSWQNTVLIKSEVVFTAIFTVECVLKITAMGFYGNSKAYLRDRWNWIDFVVVISAIVALMPGVPNLSVLRTLRVLRPIKVLSTNEDLQKIIHTISASLPELAGVTLLLFCAFLLFGIIGLQLMSGPLLHSRCRMTPYPVNNSWTSDVPFSDVAAFRCRDVDNVNVRFGSKYDKSSSPWRQAAEDCFWPLDEKDTRLCGYNRNGLHDCHHHTDRIPEEEWRWCGSNYDGFGNPRFTDKILMKSATFVEDLNYGYTNFDHIGYAVLTAFQCVTMEGWAGVMYMVQDSMSAQGAPIYFVSLVIFGAFCLVNIVLAVMANNFNSAVSSGRVRLSSIRKSVSNKQKLFGQLRIKNSNRSRLSKFLKSDQFSNIVTALIVLNTAVLATDHYPSSSEFDFGLETTNLMFTLMFCIEMVLKMVAFGVKGYCRSNLNLFDATVVIISIIEVIIIPPVLFGGDSSNRGGAITALRCFRIFRVVKLFSRWTKMKVLLKRVINIVVQTLNLVILLLLFLFINTLLGMQFFANVFRYDEDGRVISEIGSVEWINAPEQPRSNFDDFSHSFATVFQIMTTEDWNVIMYDCWRSRGAGAIVFVIINLIIGNYFLINLFLAIILNQFSAEGEESLQREVENIEFTFSDSMPSISSSKCAGTSFQSMQSSLDSGVTEIQSKNSRHASLDGNNIGDRDCSPASIVLSSSPVPRVNSVDVNCVECTRLPSKTDVSDDLRGKGKCNIELVQSSAQPLAQKESYMAVKNSENIESDSNAMESDNDADSVEDVQQTAEKSPLTCDDVLYLLSIQPLVLPWLGISYETVDKPLGYFDVIVPAERLNEVPHSMCMSVSSPFRIGLAKIIKWQHFDNVIILCICLSCVSLAMDNPLLNPNDDMPKVLTMIDLIILYIFIIEMIMKICVFGFVRSSTSYLRQGWNQLDAIVVLTSLIDLFLTGSGLGSLRAVRALRALRAVRAARAIRAFRPLRLVNRSAGLKVVINTLFNSIPDVTNVFILCFIFYFIFALIGVNYFKGGLRACQGGQFEDAISSEKLYLDILAHPQPWSQLTPIEKDLFGYYSPLYLEPVTDCARGINNSWPIVDQPCCLSYSTLSNDITSKDICLCWNAIWAKQYRYGFDNVFEGLFTLFQMSTTEGWVDAMYAIVDFRAIDMQPVRDYNVGWIYFLVFFMIVGNFFALKIFVGVIVNNFSLAKKRDIQESKGRRGQSAYMTPRQQAWVETHALLATIRPLIVIQRPENRYRQVIYDFIETKAFNCFITVCILLNTVVMGMHYFGESDLYSLVLQTLNLTFCCIFTLEVVMKIIAFGSQFNEDVSNTFDLVVVIAIDIGFVVFFVGGSRFGATVSVLQALRLAKLLKFIFNTGSVGTIMETVIESIPSIGNICLLMGLLFFVYTVMGVNLFAKVQYGEFYDHHANFRDFGTGLLLLFRAATGEGWNYVMGDLARVNARGCENDPEYDSEYCGFSDHVGCKELNGCGSYLAYPYFISFTFIITLVFLNLFIGIVLEGFESANDLNTAVTSADIKAFMRHWSNYDPTGSFFITSLQLEHFMYTLPNSLKRNSGEFSNIKEIRKFIAQSNIKIFGMGQVHFRDVLVSISRSLILQISEDEVKGTISEEAAMEMFREHLVEAENDIAKIRALKAFSPFTTRKVLSKQTATISRSIQEDYAARFLLACLRRAVYRRKRAQAREAAICNTFSAAGGRVKDGSDPGYEVLLPEECSTECSIVLVDEDRNLATDSDNKLNFLIDETTTAKEAIWPVETSAAAATKKLPPLVPPLIPLSKAGDGIPDYDEFITPTCEDVPEQNESTTELGISLTECPQPEEGTLCASIDPQVDRNEQLALHETSCENVFNLSKKVEEDNGANFDKGIMHVCAARADTLPPIMSSGNPGNSEVHVLDAESAPRLVQVIIAPGSKDNCSTDGMCALPPEHESLLNSVRSNEDLSVSRSFPSTDNQTFAQGLILADDMKVHLCPHEYSDDKYSEFADGSQQRTKNSIPPDDAESLINILYLNTISNVELNVDTDELGSLGDSYAESSSSEPTGDDLEDELGYSPDRLASRFIVMSAVHEDEDDIYDF